MVEKLERGLYLIVMHTWWSTHISWKKRLVNAESLREAKKEAALWEKEIENTWERVSTIVIPLQFTIGELK